MYGFCTLCAVRNTYVTLPLFIHSSKLYENLRVQDLRMELHLRGVEVNGKKKPQFEKEFEELCKGITNVPALLHNIPDTPLEALYLHHYEVSPTEPLHDVKGHLSNLTDELRSVVTGEAVKNLFICTREGDTSML